MRARCSVREDDRREAPEFREASDPALYGVVRFVLSTISRVNQSPSWTFAGSLDGMDIEIRAVDPHDEAALAARHAVSDAALAHDVPDFPSLCPVMYAATLRAPGRAEKHLSWVGYLAGEPAGVLDMMLPLLDNTGSARIDLKVLPEHRRRGVGSALRDFAADEARRYGRVRLQGDSVTALPGGGPRDPAGCEFARAMGAKLGLEEVRRRLDLSTV